MRNGQVVTGYKRTARTSNLLVLAAVAATTLAPGCITRAVGNITAAYHESNEKRGDVEREFRQHLGTVVYKGVWAGEQEFRGARCHHLQFANLLKGRDRYLDVLISATGEVFLIESPKRLAGSRPAYLILQATAPMDSDGFYALFEQQVGKESAPAAILAEHFDYEVTERRYPFAIVKLDFASTDQYTSTGIVWELREGRSIVDLKSLTYEPYDGPHLRIAWKVRNCPGYQLRKVGYVGTVLADIVTSPVQIVMYLVIGLTYPAF